MFGVGSAMHTGKMGSYSPERWTPSGQEQVYGDTDRKSRRQHKGPFAASSARSGAGGVFGGHEREKHVQLSQRACSPPRAGVRCLRSVSIILRLKCSPCVKLGMAEISGRCQLLPATVERVTSNSEQW